MNEILEKLKQYADEAHGSQMRKYAHLRYIVHPVEVMEICREYTSDLCYMMCFWSQPSLAIGDSA